jgi:hypothetical protein
MLGLGPYLMITEENIPSVRGASQAYSCPLRGTWVKALQRVLEVLSMGTKVFRDKLILNVKPISDIPFF